MNSYDFYHGYIGRDSVNPQQEMKLWVEHCLRRAGQKNRRKQRN